MTSWQSFFEGVFADIHWKIWLRLTVTLSAAIPLSVCAAKEGWI